MDMECITGREGLGEHVVRKPHPIGGRASVTERRIHVGRDMIGLSDGANLLAVGSEPILFESGEQAGARGRCAYFRRGTGT